MTDATARHSRSSPGVSHRICLVAADRLVRAIPEFYEQPTTQLTIQAITS